MQKRLQKQRAIEQQISSGKLTDEEADLVLHDWRDVWARPTQILPDDDVLFTKEEQIVWVTWLILAGRGWGKTKTGAEAVIEWAKGGTLRRIALVAQDAADARDVMVEGDSGIMESSPHNFMPIYEPSKRRLTWPNGVKAYTFSAEDPESLRGPQFHAAWCDELCKWSYLQDTWDNLQFGLRLGTQPRQIITTTPRPLKILKQIILRDDTVITKGSTHENLNNLAGPFRKAVVDRYAGTRLGRQELNAEILDDIPGAMFQRSNLDDQRASRKEGEDAITYNAKKVDIAEVVVAVDPPATSEEGSAEAGIVGAAKGRDGRGYILADRSQPGSPDEWGTAAVKLFDELQANWMIYEANQGGDMVAHVLTSCAKALKAKGERDTDFLPLKAVHASRGKATRAEPVSALYEQKKVSHVGFQPLLEDQMCEFTSDFDKDKAGYSPDRLDAMVWAVTHLLVTMVDNEGLMEWYRMQAANVGKKLDNAITDTTQPTVEMIPPPGCNQAHGMTGRVYRLEADGIMRVMMADSVLLQKAGFRKKD